MQTATPESRKNTRSDPLLKPIVGGAAGADVGCVQCVPLATRSQYEEDGIHAFSVIDPWPPATEPMRVHMLG